MESTSNKVIPLVSKNELENKKDGNNDSNGIIDSFINTVLKVINFLIEFQGIQHYEPKSKFGGVSGLNKQKYNDAQKRKYCKLHNITLIAIPYWDEHIMNYDYIMKAANGW